MNQVRIIKNPGGFLNEKPPGMFQWALPTAISISPLQGSKFKFST